MKLHDYAAQGDIEGAKKELRRGAKVDARNKQDMTPVYRLNCKTWKIEMVETSGENPGWIYKHKAVLTNLKTVVISAGTVCSEQDGEEDHTDNTRQFLLDLESMRWAQID